MVNNVFNHRGYLYFLQHVFQLMQEDGIFLLEGYYPKLLVLHVSELPKFIGLKSISKPSTQDIPNIL